MRREYTSQACPGSRSGAPTPAAARAFSVEQTRTLNRSLNDNKAQGDPAWWRWPAAFGLAALFEERTVGGNAASLTNPSVPDNGRRLAECLVKEIVALILAALQNYAMHRGADRDLVY